MFKKEARQEIITKNGDYNYIRKEKNNLLWQSQSSSGVDKLQQIIV